MTLEILQFQKKRYMVEMTYRCNQEHERNGDVSSSDDDSVSLLCDCNAWQSRGAAEDMEISDLDSQFGNKEQRKEVEMERNQFKPPEPGISSGTQSAAGCAGSTSQSAAKVSQCVKNPNKMQINKRNEKGETLLHRACKREDLARVKVLIQAGISVNMEDYAGWTALHEACVAGDEAVVEELLKAGANVNARSSDGVTPLHDAVAVGHYQVVKLLLQHGSNASDRTVGGLSALDMAPEQNIKELLSFRLSSVPHEQPCEAPAQCRQPGDTSSEVHCQSSLRPSCSDSANVQSRESGDRDGAREPGDIQLRKKDTTTDNLSHSEAIPVVLEEVGRKQTEILTWPLTGPEDADRYQAALTQIQIVLVEVLSKQLLEKDNLAQKYRSVPDFFRQCVLKSHLVSLASRQRTFVAILQKQTHLVEVYVNMKAKFSPQPPNHQDSTVMRQQSDHCYALASTPASSKAREAHSCNQRQENHRPVKQTSLLRSAPPNNVTGRTVPRPPAPPLAQGKKAATHTDVLNKKASSCQSSTPQPGNTLQHINFQMKGNNTLIQTRAEDTSTHLSQLVQRGVTPSGSALQLLLKGHWHLAHVLADGSIKDSKGKLHRAPECWLESILGNNIPVSSAYAWDKVTFRDKPLSHYLLNTEAGGKKPGTHPEDEGQHMAGSSQEALTTEAASLRRLMKIKIIHLVGDDEMLPNAIMDCYWEKLLMKDYSESEDWGGELL
ncbi:ankyrin repeat domain-containing protein 31-like isoform X3 [Sebastes umbrosus]|uniref:ankyrin repeat domain-containing protein 31-like isoform X3 n=1 Tax=Sebastes umbrosus TaxID=72105 RepID=UPI00189DCC12|nr:ankyrin repeat domain-containing protein 31-like isoform X3 [Sebastes umbrosus]